MHKAIATENAPKAIGPYSQAVQAGEFVFISGMIPIDPATGAMIPGGIEEQTVKALENLGAVLAACGADYADIVKTTVFLCDLGNFSIVNELYARFFQGPVLPARSAVQVAALPKNSMIEIEAIVRK